MKIQYIILKCEKWLSEFINLKIFWVLSPIIISLSLSILVFVGFVSSIKQERIIININKHGEMYIEIFLLGLCIITSFVSFIQILRWRHQYEKTILQKTLN